MIAGPAAAIADTLARAAPAGTVGAHVHSLFVGPPEFAAALERWHDFFLLTGTAAVTLVGLLFVALSLHLDALIHERRVELLGLARLTLGSFTVVMVLSITLLAPGLSPWFAGFSVMVFGALWSVFTLRYIAGVIRKRDLPGRGQVLRRSILPLIGFLTILDTGWLLRQGRALALYYLIGIICMLLSNAAVTSWELIVRVGRLKRDEAEAPPPAEPAS